MKRLQRIISGMLAVCLLISIVPMGTWAAETEPEVETVPDTTVFETQESPTEITVAETTVPVVMEDISETTVAEMVSETTVVEMEPDETAVLDIVPEETISLTATPASTEYTEDEINAMISAAAYPDMERPCWIIFYEGYRDSRVEMSVFDLSDGDEEPYIIWDRGLELNDGSRFSDCNQYYIENSCWTLFVQGYDVLSDYSTGIIASNLDVYDGSGNLVCEATSYPGLGYELEVSDTVSGPVATGEFSNNKYEVYDLSMTWTEAKAYCEELGGHLVTITSAEEQAFIESLLPEPCTKAHYWIGANYEAGSWNWVTDEAFEYSNWNDDQPDHFCYNDIYEEYAMIHNCTTNSIYDAVKYKWNDMFDDVSLHSDSDVLVNAIGFICEYSSNVETSLVVEAVFDNRKYEVYDLSMTWSEAKAYCEELGGHLVTITSAEEQAFIETLLPEPCTKNQYWIGMRYEEDAFRWITGETVNYTNWDVTQPDRYAHNEGIESVVHIFNATNYELSPDSRRYAWNDMLESNNCPGQLNFCNAETVGFICEYEAEADLTGWQKAYYDYIVVDKKNGYSFDRGDGLVGTWDDSVTYELIYLNGDNNPELYITYQYDAFAHSHDDKLIMYIDGNIIEKSFNGAWLRYENNCIVDVIHKVGNSHESNEVMQITNEDWSSLAFGIRFYDAISDGWDCKWDDVSVTEEEYAQSLAKWVDVENAYTTGDGTIYDYDGILAYLLNAKSEEVDKKENGLIVSSDYTNLSVSIGSVLTLSVGILVDGERISDVSGITFQVIDTSILESVGTGISNNNRYIELKGKAEGLTTVVVSDSATGYTAKVPISVYKNNVHSYALSNVPEQHISKYPTNFYNINGLFIDSYTYSINDNKTANISFDVYNSNFSFGAVEVYDKHGNMTDAVIIKKMTSSSTSIKEALFDNIGYIIRDFRDGDWLTYRQESGYTKKTHVVIENIPQNGYIAIGTDPLNSFVVALVNAVDIIMAMSSIEGDIKNFDAYSDAFAEKITEELLSNDIYATMLTEGNKLAKKMWKSVGKQTFISSESMSNFTNSIMNNLDSLNLGGLIASTAEGFGWSVGTKVFTHFTGPIGAALNFLFIMGKATDTITQFADLGQSENAGSIYIHNQGGGFRAAQQIIIESETDFSNETALNVFSVALDNEYLNVLKELSPDAYEAITEGITYTYSISLLENGKEVQPGDVVTVYIPIPEDLQILAYLGQVTIYRIEEDGTVTEMDTKIEDGFLVFTTEHLSLYSIVGFDPNNDAHKHTFTDGICDICGIIGGNCGEALTWLLGTNGALIISGTGAMYDFETGESPWDEYRTQIKEIILPDGLTYVGDEAFRGLYKVKHVSIPGTVTEIGSCAFITAGLTSVSLPEGLLVIGESAFHGTRLTSVDIPDSVATIGAWAFHQNSLESLYIPAGVTEIGRAAFSDNTRLQTITVDSENANFVADASGVLYSKDMTTLYQCPGGFSGEYVIPEGVTTLECSAFDGCRGLTKITIPDSVIYMPWQSTFADCTGLTELILPDGIKRLEYAFAFGAENLTNVKLPGQLTQLGDAAFFRCSSLTRIVIPEYVTEIGSACFKNTSLNSIIFRGNAPTINEIAFDGLTATAYYPGNDTTWTADIMQDYGGTITWVPYYESENVTRIEAEKVVLEAGESIDLTAVLDPGVLQAEEVIWTLYDEGNGGGTTLAGNGTATVLTAGWYIYDNVIMVTAQTATSTADPAVLEITIKERPANIILFSGQTKTLKEYDYATGEYYSSKRLTWSTYDEYAPYVTLTSTGRLTAKKVVTKTRILIFGDIDGQPGFMRIVDILPSVTHVEVQDEEGIIVNGKTVTVDFSDEETAFIATAYPLDTMQRVQWIISDAQKQAFAEYEINGDTMTVVNPTGKAGTVTVKAVVEAGQKKTVTFKLQFGSFAQNVVITAAASEIHSGGSLQLSAVTVPSAPTKAGITWSLSKDDKAYASISSSGLLKAKTVYDRTVITVLATSKDGQAQAEYPIVILPANERMLVLRSDGKNVTMGTAYTDMNGDGTITLTAEYFDGSQPSVTWTVQKSVEVLAMTETSLIIRFLKAGTVTIKATDTNGQKATVKVIAAQMAQSVEISQKKTGITEGLEVSSGKSLDLQATIENAKNKKVTWSLAPGDEAYAKISSSGKLTASKDLTSMRQVTVTATAADGSGVSDDMIVTIRPIAQGVQVYSEAGGRMLFSFRTQNWWVRSNTTLNWDLSTQADTIAMAAHVYPYYGDDDAKNAMQAVTWKSSAPKIAEFLEDEEGNVSLKLHKTGSVTVTTTADDGSGQKVTFKLKVVKTVTELEIENQTLQGGKSLNLAKLVTIKPVDATNKKLIWEITYGSEYATISSSGTIKAKKVSATQTVVVRVRSQDGGTSRAIIVTITP